MGPWTLSDTNEAILTDTGSPDNDDPLERINTFVDIVGTSLTALALLVGGFWVYFKFVKGRTFRPRIELGLRGQWHEIGERPVLQVHLTIKNIGASKVVLMQEGTALIVKKPSPNQPSPPGALRWDEGEVFEIFLEHHWIEPDEIVSDDLLIDLAEDAPVPTLLNARTIWKRTLFKNIDVSAREFVNTGPVMARKQDGYEPS